MALHRAPVLCQRVAPTAGGGGGGGGGGQGGGGTADSRPERISCYSPAAGHPAWRGGREL